MKTSSSVTMVNVFNKTRSAMVMTTVMTSRMNRTVVSAVRIRIIRIPYHSGLFIKISSSKNKFNYRSLYFFKSYNAIIN